jgi:acyl-CoA thioester hydrolase
MRNAGVPEPFSWPRVTVSCEYEAAARFEDVLELRYRITRVGKKSLDQVVEFLRDGKRIALGNMKTVCCAMGPDGFRAIPIPARVREKLNE